MVRVVLVGGEKSDDRNGRKYRYIEKGGICVGKWWYSFELIFFGVVWFFVSGLLGCYFLMFRRLIMMGVLSREIVR